MTDSNDSNNLPPDDSAQPRVVIDGETPRGPNRFASLLARRQTLIMMGIVLAFVLVIAIKGCGNEPVPSQRLGVAPQAARPVDPNRTADYVADPIKDRDAKAAKSLLNSDKAVEGGAAYMPEVTREWEDPLADYASANSRSDLSETNISAQVPPPPQPTKTRTKIERDAGDPRVDLYLNALKNFDGMRADLLDAKTDVKPVTLEMAKDDQKGTLQPVTAAGHNVPANGPKPTAKAIGQLGQVLYAVMDLEANSDYSRFVQATVVGGPFAGAKFQGTFRRTEDRLEIVFTRANWKQRTYKVSAIAVNPEEPEVGLATEVNHHYIERYGGVFAAAFLRGVGTEIARSGTRVSNGVLGNSTVEVPKRDTNDLLLIGGAEVGAELGQAMRQNFNRPPTVIVAASTPVGLLLTQDWLDDPNAAPDAFQPTPESAVATLPPETAPGAASLLDKDPRIEQQSPLLQQYVTFPTVPAGANSPEQP